MLVSDGGEATDTNKWVPRAVTKSGEKSVTREMGRRVQNVAQRGEEGRGNGPNARWGMMVTCF